MDTEIETSIEPIDTLEPYPGNPNEGDVGATSDSMTRNGWYGTIVVQKSRRRILAGHHRVIAARQLGASHVPVAWADVDDATAHRIMLADNRTTRRGRDDGELLLAALRHGADEPLVGLSGTGWDSDDLGRLVKRLEPSTLRITPDTNKPIQHVCPECGHEWAGKPS